MWGQRVKFMWGQPPSAVRRAKPRLPDVVHLALSSLSEVAVRKADGNAVEGSLHPCTIGADSGSSDDTVL
jgi:hypothetical protein